MRLQQENPTCRVTVVRSGGLGDTILLLPTLRVLTRMLPEAQITLVGSSWARRLLPLLPERPRFVPFDSPDLTHLFSPNARKEPAGVFAEADLVIIYTADGHGPLAQNARRLCDGGVLNWPVEPPGRTHAACHFAAALLHEYPGLQDIPEPRLSNRLRAEPKHSPKRPTAAVHPGSGGHHKVWPVCRFVHLIQELDALGVEVFMPQGPADAQLCSELCRRLPNGSLKDPEQLPLVNCAARLSTCDVYIGNDSGVSHLAAALGVPTVAIFGPTDPAVWRPVGQHVKVVDSRNSGDWKWPDVGSVLLSIRKLLDTPHAADKGPSESR